MSHFAVVLYRLMERVDGERGSVRLLSYAMAERIKVWLLGFIR